MRHRSSIAVIVVLALVLGTFAPLACVVCAMGMGPTAGCPSCTPPGPHPSRTSIGTDRSCCAAPSLVERDPATTAPDRAAHRVGNAVTCLPASSVHLVVTAPRHARAFGDMPETFPPSRRTTVLLN